MSLLKRLQRNVNDLHAIFERPVLSYDCLCECHLDDGQADHLYRMSQSPLWDRLKPQQAGRLDNKFGLQ